MHYFLSLKHFIPLLYFYTSWKHQKTRFADVFRDYRKRPVVWNALIREAFIKTWLIKKASECYFEFLFHFPEAVVRRCFVKKMFLKIPQNLLENTCTRVSFFNKVTEFMPQTLLKTDFGTVIFLWILQNF